MGSILLSGCSSFQTPSGNTYTDELITKVPIYTWSVRGEMLFSCAYDDAGFYWQFIRSEGTLKNDQGKIMGTLSPDLSIRSPNGQVLKMMPFKTGDAKHSNGLKNLLFKVTSSPNTGTFKNVQFVERRNAKGGVPLTRCSAIQKEQLLRVPFEARYIFWR